MWSDAYPDEHLVDLPEAEALEAVGEDAVGFAHYEAGEVASFVLRPQDRTEVPPLWFAEIDEPDGTPPASSLVAFSGHDVAPGRLLSRAAVRDVEVTSSDQVGAVRWYPATGEVDQVYVAPTWRRRGVGTSLLLAGGILNAARGLPRWWGDGQRTAEGERWRASAPWGHRGAELTHLSPPMTPFDQR